MNEEELRQVMSAAVDVIDLTCHVRGLASGA
jgi:hypothetical protein